jgi:hypothetical protein
MCSKKHNRYSGRDNHENYEDNRFNDGKHYNKKNKPSEKKSRNNVKQSLRKELYY